MLNHPDLIKKTLTSIIREMSASSMLYVKNPEKDFSRTRKLPFESIMLLLISMGGNSLYKELLESQGYDLNTVTTSAFVQRRDKILPCAFEYLLHEFTSSCARFKKYQGYRLLAVDGSDFHSSPNPNDEDSFFQHPGAQGYNLTHLTALYDLCNRLYIDAVVKPRRKRNEYEALVTMVDRSRINDNVILVADRGFESYNNLAHIEQKGWHYVIRVKDIISGKGILSGLHLPKDGEFDESLSFTLTRKNTNAVKANPHIYKRISAHCVFDFLNLYDNQFYPISFRVVRILLPNGTYESLITNLDSDAFPPDALKEIYRRRWGIETSFRELKYTIGLANFHSKKLPFITQEIFARLIMYNFVEIITSRVLISQSNRRYAYKVNFTNAAHVCRRFLRLGCNEPPLDVQTLIKKSITPIRPLRQGVFGVRKSNPKSAFSFIYRVA